MRYPGGILLTVFLCAVLAGCQSKGASSEALSRAEEDSLSIITATDLHYLSPALNDGGAAFSRMMAKGDGKMTEYVSEITDAFLSEVLSARPDALILSGDLAFNGEKQSHTDLAAKLETISAAGIPVLVIPGNHDIYYPFSLRYEGEETFRTANVSPAEFEEIYQDMGYSGALSRDMDSLSYIYPLSDTVWILLLDANAVEKAGTVPDTTLQWAEEQLEKAKESGITVLSVTHQNVMIHNELLTRGYVLSNYKKISALLSKYNVPLNLSGHIHVQHISRSEDICEAATGSLSVYPNQYGIITVREDGSISYRTKETDVSGWAKAQGETSSDLLDFVTVSKEHFDSRNSAKIVGELEYFDVTSDEKQSMARFATEVNRMYFAGTLWEQREQLKTSDTWGLFEEKGDESFLKEYLDSMMDGGSEPDNTLDIPGRKAVKTTQ